jgi:hypothetical protein
MPARQPPLIAAAPPVAIGLAIAALNLCLESRAGYQPAAQKRGANVPERNLQRPSRGNWEPPARWGKCYWRICCGAAITVAASGRLAGFRGRMNDMVNHPNRTQPRAAVDFVVQQAGLLLTEVGKMMNPESTAEEQAEARTKAMRSARRTAKALEMMGGEHGDAGETNTAEAA